MKEHIGKRILTKSDRNIKNSFWSEIFLSPVFVSKAKHLVITFWHQLGGCALTCTREPKFPPSILPSQ